MLSFGQFLTEDTRADMALELLKIAKVHPGTEVGTHSQTMADRRLAKMNSSEAEKIRKTAAAWKPGACPDCNGMGIQSDGHKCWTCVGTGLEGMNDAQGKWYVKTRTALQKAHDAIMTADHGWREMKRQFGVDQEHKLPETKIIKDIVTAAKRAGVNVPNDYFDFGKHDRENEGLTSEYYQGHEYDFYLNAAEHLLWGLAKKMAERVGWKEPTQDFGYKH